MTRVTVTDADGEVLSTFDVPAYILALAAAQLRHFAGRPYGSKRNAAQLDKIMAGFDNAHRRTREKALKAQEDKA